jgi:hypothetical protein
MSAMLRLTLSVVASLAVVALSPVGVRTQSAVARHDLTARPPLEVNANIRVHKVMGETGTFMVGEFRPGFRNTPHHHTHDQINVGISNTFDIVTPAKSYPVSRLRGLMIPADVSHGNLVATDAAAPLLIEFQPVRRTDFPPEREKVVFPTASAPTPPPADSLELDFRPGSATWQRHPSGVRVSSRKGVRAAVSAMEIPASLKTPIAIRSQLPDAELFVYVLDGSVEASAGNTRHTASTGILFVNPPIAPSLHVRSMGPSASVLLIFEAVKAK